jgi:hypothetical protein
MSALSARQQFVSVEIKHLVWLFGSFVIGPLFTFWPRIAARLYPPWFPIGIIRIIGLLSLALGAWSAFWMVADHLH